MPNILNNVTFNRGQGGLGRPLASNDNYTGFVFYNDALPTGFATNDRIKKVFSLQDVTNLGIVNNFSDEIKATGGTVLVVTTGGTGTVWSVKINDAIIGSYTEVSADNATAVATGLSSAINTSTSITNYSASSSTATLQIIQPIGIGSSLNAGLSVVNTAGSATTTQFNSGVGSYQSVMYYHLSEYFRIQQNGVAFVGVFPASADTTYTGVEIQTIQDFANGELRQIAVFLKSAFSTAQITASQVYATTNETNFKPANILLTSNLKSASLSSLATLQTLNSKNVSYVIAQDGNYSVPVYVNTKSYIAGDKVRFNGSVYIAKTNSVGNIPTNTAYFTFIMSDLVSINNFSISNLGVLAGSVSLSKVSECVAWIQKFDISSGYINDTAGFTTGDVFKTISVNQLNTLNQYNYIFNRNLVGISGTYFNDSWTSILRTSDYVTIENNRTIDKATRLIRTNLLPQVAAPLYLTASGTLSEDTVAYFENLTSLGLTQMQIDGEISSFSITINPEQNVLSTSQLVVSVKIVPVGVAREIIVNIAFALSV